MLFGLVGAGKTTLARELEQRGAIRLSLDEWTIAASGDQVHLDKAVEQRMVAQLMRFWPRLLVVGVDVVLDFGFWDRKLRDEVRAIARSVGATVNLIWVQCSDDERRRRSLLRSSDGPDGYQIDAGGFDWIAANRTIDTPGPDEAYAVIDTSQKP